MKILKPETTLASATHVYKSSVVRLFNSGDSNILVTRKNESASTIGSFMVPAGEVVYCEKDYTDTLEGGADVKVTKTAFSPMMSFVGQIGDPVPTYTHSVSTSSVDEGGSFTTTITTTNVDDGTNLYWELSGTNITSADFSSGALTGTASISSNSATFSHTVANDTLTEGTETVTIKVYSDSGRNTQVGNTLSVTLADTSTTPVNDPGHYSVRFNADAGDTNEQLSVTNSDYATGNNEFTVEAFAKIYSLDTYNTIFGTRNSNGNVAEGWTVGMQSNKQFYFYSTGFHIDTAAQTGIDDEEWFHIAIQRENPSSGNVFKLYLNGTVIGSTTQNKNFTNTKFNIGTESSGQQWNGWISNVRFSTTLVYPWNGFTAPTTPLSTTSQGASNVKYLGCRDSTLAATHISNGTQVTQGSPTVSTDDPFASVNNNYAVDFTGTQDVRRVTASHSSLAIGTNEFTIECWFKTASIAASVSPSSYHTIIGSREENTDNAGGGIILALNDSGKFVIFSSGFHINPDLSVWDAANYINQWVHVALTRDGNNLLTLWLDGANKGTMSNFTNNLTRSAFAFGNLVNTGQEDFSGLISNARITIGQALYSSAFTPSTEPLTVSSQGATASNVKFLGLNASSVTSDSIGTATVTSNNTPTSTTGPF